MRYIRSENLKYKRSFSRKLIFVVPIITAFVAVIFGGIRNFQAQVTKKILLGKESNLQGNYVYSVIAR